MSAPRSGGGDRSSADPGSRHPSSERRRGEFSRREHRVTRAECRVERPFRRYSVGVDVGRCARHVRHGRSGAALDRRRYWNRARRAVARGHQSIWNLERRARPVGHLEEPGELRPVIVGSDAAHPHEDHVARHLRAARLADPFAERHPSPRGSERPWGRRHSRSAVADRRRDEAEDFVGTPRNATSAPESLNSRVRFRCRARYRAKVSEITEGRATTTDARHRVHQRSMMDPHERRSST